MTIIKTINESTYSKYFNLCLNALYTVSSILGAILIASNTNNNKLGYISFTISSLLCIYMMRKDTKNWSIVLVSLVFGVINIVGYIRA